MAAQVGGEAAVSRHQQIIESLARENHAPLEHVRALFERQHSQLQSDARVKTFVAVIATRLVRQTLHAERVGRA
jgi:hypothetical protein